MAETKYNLLTRLLKDLRNQVSSSGDIGGKSNGGTLVVHEVVDGDVLLDSPISEVDGYRFYTAERDVGDNLNPMFYCIDFNLDVESLDDLVVRIYIMDMGMDIPPDSLSLKTEGSNSVITVYQGPVGNDDPPIEAIEYVITHHPETGEELRIKVIADQITRLDKSYKEIEDAGFAVFRANNDVIVYGLTEIGYNGEGFTVMFANNEAFLYQAETVDDYPKKVIAEGGTK